jgi:hypothetical protein
MSNNHEQASKEYTVIVNTNFHGKVVRHRRERSPDPATQRREKLLKSMVRVELNPRMTREIYTPVVARRGNPTDPCSSWMAAPSLSFGGAIPSYVNLEEPRVGRVVEHGTSSTCALFPASPDNVYCPPYPGLLPCGLDDPHDPLTCFTDGSLGKFDPRFYPQVFDSKRPWLPFHNGPGPIGPINDLPIAYSPACSFFHWFSSSEPAKGGRWKRELIAILLRSRRNAEVSVEVELEIYRRANPLDPLDMTAWTLPVHDMLTYEQTEQWTTYQEGRDAIGRTARYTAELQAMGRWLYHFRAIVRDRSSPSALSPSPRSSQGTWMSPQLDQRNWDIMNRASVPIYILAELPSAHPLTQLPLSTFDVGEHLRVNPFEGIHGVGNTWRTPPAYKFVPSSHTSPLQAFPRSLFQPIRRYPPTPSPDPGPTAWYMPWTYRLSDDFGSLSQPEDPPVFFDTKARVFQERCYGLFWHLGPQDIALNKQRDWHPFFHVCSEAEAITSACYQEKFDQALSKWSFKRVSSNQQEKCAESSRYIFFYPKESITIYSAHPFPGRSTDFCRTSTKGTEEPETSLESTRHYFRHRSSRRGWTCSIQDSDRVSTGDGGTLSQDTLNAVSSLAMESMEIISPCEDEQQVDEMPADNEEDRSNPSELLSGDKDQLIAQRDAVDLWADRRLFHSLYGPEASSRGIVAWSSPELSNGPVWCIRIGRLHDRASLNTVLDMLRVHCEILRNDVHLGETYLELDLTRTVDLGLRYPEDALWIWLTLHGVRVDECCIEVHPLCKLHKPTKLVQSTSERSHEERLKKARAIAELGEIWPKKGSFEEDIARVLDELSSPDAREPSMEIIKGEFNNQLIFVVTDKRSSSD